MTKKQADMFAKIHAGTMIGFADGFMFMDNVGNHGNVPEIDQQKMVDACCRLSNKLLGELPEIVNSVEIYNYVLANF